MAIGRLDVNSEGLLLLTTNGKVSEEIRSRKVEKEYYVQVDGCITQEDINILKSGVVIGFKLHVVLLVPFLNDNAHGAMGNLSNSSHGFRLRR